MQATAIIVSYCELSQANPSYRKLLQATESYRKLLRDIAS